MDQSARLVWYHDHAVGITRTNAYAGIASALLMTDNFESGLISSGLLPDLVGIPLVIQDKSFVPSNILTEDPTWQWGQARATFGTRMCMSQPGRRQGAPSQLRSQPDGPVGLWPLLSATVLPRPPLHAAPAGAVVAEAFFDTILVNGGVYPVVSVPPRRVRFRMLNGSQARFYHLNLYPGTSSTFR